MLPEYSRELLHRELMLFPEWYVGRHKGVTLDDKQRASLDQVFERILARNLAEPKVFVHRDFHSRNLMLSSPNPGVLDFQDAVHGPLSYDLVSLFKDAYIRWDEDFILDMLARYWDIARRLGLPVREDFPSSIAISNGWGSSVTSRCWGYSPGCTIATARTATSRTCRW